MSGGGSNDAQRAAERAEAERQARIREATARINAAFDNPNRAQERTDFFNATRAYNMDDLNRQKSDADRNLKFAMARSGLTGGSTAIDNARRLGEDYTRGVIEADRRAQSALADLNAADEGSRLQLIQMAQSGLDATTGSARAFESLRNNLQANRATATAQGVGDVFSRFADIYRQSQTEAERRRGERYVYDTLYKPGFGYGSGFSGGP